MPTYQAILAATPPAIVTTALLAEYRFLEGTGLTAYDVSGNAKHATLSGGAATPTWTTTGLSFDGGDFVTTPTLAAVYGIDIVFKPSVAWSAATSAGAALMGPQHAEAAAGIIGVHTGSITNEILIIRQTTTGGYASSGRVYYAHASDTITAAWHLLQMDVRAASDFWTLKLDGTEKRSGTEGTPPGTGFLSAGWIIGDSFSNAPITGDIACVVLYGDQGGGLGRNDAAQAQNRAALQTRMAQRGITLP